MAPKSRTLTAVVEPPVRLYNGLGMLRPSVCVQLQGGDFEAEFDALWNEHVDFGTARSHKKLLKRDRDASEWRSRLAAKQAVEVVPEPGKKKRPKWGAAVEDDSPLEPASLGQQAAPAPVAVGPTTVGARPRAPQQPKAQLLANKGRWGSTLASQLLGT